MTTALTRQLCNQLIENNSALTEITIDLGLAQLSHEDNRILIFEALKRNKTITSLIITQGQLSMRASLSLAAGLLRHPTLSRLSILDVEMESSFGVLALAIQENKSLISLRLSFQGEETVWTHHLNESVRCLVASNSLEELSIDGAGSHDDVVHRLDLAGALCRNHSLKRIRFGWTSIMTEGTVRDIARLLRTNQTIQSLHLADISDYRGAVELIAVAATGHESLEDLCLNADLSGHGSSTTFDVQAVSSMLHNSPKMKHIRLDLFHLGEEDICRLFDSLKSKSCNVETLSFCGGEMSHVALSRLADILSENDTVTRLRLDGNSIADDCVSYLVKILNQSRTIEKLSLAGNNLGAKGMSAIADALVRNTSLKELDLSSNSLKNDAAIAVVSMLEVNTTLVSVSVGRVGDADPAADEIIRKVNHLTALNRGGRRILKAASVPSALWPLILARSSNDPGVLYSFLREKPADLIGTKIPAAPSRKRKRDWFEGILW